MIIQINTDKTLNGDSKMQEYFTSEIEEALKRHETHITRIEVHLKDENKNEEGLNELSCMLEARLKGRKPIAITNNAASIEVALSGALTKTETAIETILGRIQSY